MSYRELRIPVEIVQEITGALFNRARFTGGELSRAIKEDPNTVWAWFRRRGVPPDVARKIANVLIEWANELIEKASELRRHAVAAEEGHYLADDEELVRVPIAMAEPVKRKRGRPHKIRTPQVVEPVAVSVPEGDPIARLIRGATPRETATAR
jgi:hypothetical protein